MTEFIIAILSVVLGQAIACGLLLLPILIEDILDKKKERAP
jgi:hypothetical protein